MGAMTFENTVPALAASVAFFELLTGSYNRLLGSPLCEEDRGLEWLYLEAPFAVLAHNTDADPRFIYANRCAQQWFGYSWEEFAQLRSRLSAEAPEQAERDKLLASVNSSKAGQTTVDPRTGKPIATGAPGFAIAHNKAWTGARQPRGVKPHR